MVFMSKEHWEAHKRMQHYSWEINICMQEQGFMYFDMEDKEITNSLRVYTEIMGELKK